MMRFFPRSLLGQVMLALAVALLVAQAISATLLYQASEQRREMALIHAAAFQVLSGSAPPRGEPGEGRRHHAHGPHHLGPEARALPRLPRILRIEHASATPLQQGETRQPGREEAIRELMEDQGIALDDVVVVERPFSRDPLTRAAIASSPDISARLSGLDPSLVIIGVKREGMPGWQVARVPKPMPDPGMLPGLVVQTLILFAVLFGLLYLVLRRIIRPLAMLAERTRRFSGSPLDGEPLAPSGPDDVKDLIEAHNAMQARIGAMLDEKDVMLGAIGHDLKTPLAALRVRIEGVEDDTARSRMAATVEDIARTLDEILALARVGRPSDLPERTDLAALAASVVEEFEDLGQPVTLDSPVRLVAPARLTWLKRGLRNLVVNALRYGGNARVSLRQDGAEAVLTVEDDGPGIPEDRIAEMTEPFTRGEASRNRETGGAGLGLALTRAVAEQHGGRLVLANRREGGLRAELRLPLG